MNRIQMKGRVSDVIPGKRLRSVTDRNRRGGQYGRIAEGCVSNVQVLKSVDTDCEHTVPVPRESPVKSKGKDVLPMPADHSQQCGRYGIGRKQSGVKKN